MDKPTELSFEECSETIRRLEINKRALNHEIDQVERELKKLKTRCLSLKEYHIKEFKTHEMSGDDADKFLILWLNEKVDAMYHGTGASRGLDGRTRFVGLRRRLDSLYERPLLETHWLEDKLWFEERLSKVKVRICCKRDSGYTFLSFLHHHQQGNCWCRAEWVKELKNMKQLAELMIRIYEVDKG